MLHKVLAAAGLEERNCALLLGVNPSLFSEWASGQTRIPESVLPELSAILGVQEAILRHGKPDKHMDEADITPAIWYKFRGDKLVDADREYVVLIRQLGHFVNQLEEATGRKSAQWKTLFESIREEVNLQAPPREQGRTAAKIFREATSMGHGATGSGEVLRGLLRSLGVLVIETPIRESNLEGCSFYVGAPDAARPCVFANTHHVTWFRRNVVLMHEVGHAIFEAAYSGAALDFVTDGGTDASEIRAQAFAQESLAPREVLVHLAQKDGLKWSKMSDRGLARIVADSHVELRTVVAAALESGLISEEDSKKLRCVDISAFLPELTDHALSTEQYLAKSGAATTAQWVGKRTSTLPLRQLRLPIGYVMNVLEAYKNREISLGKASELLMIDRADFKERFGDAVAETEQEFEALAG